jgi:methionine-rich copper-binding protein CopC
LKSSFIANLLILTWSLFKEDEEMKIFQNKMSALRNTLVGATLIVTASSAFAHVKLESAIPAINASVASQPKNITLNFGEEVMLMNVKLLDAQRKDIPLN